MELEPDGINISDNCTAIHVATHAFILTQQITVCLTCVLSIFGAGLIIFTYVAFKDLRTGARELLVQLSIADICVALSHMVGVLVNLPKHAHPCHNPVVEDGSTDVVCEVQAGVTMFGVVSSFLWTLAVAVYLLVIIVFEKQVVGRRLRFVFYPICWGIPLTLAIVFGCQGYLGFDDSLDVGWCYTTWINTTSNTQRRAFLPQVLGYNIWIYLIYILLPLLYFWIRCYVRVKLSRVHNKIPLSAKLQSKSRLSDVKLTFIPVIFLILRLSGVILAIPHTYLPFEQRLDFRTTWWNAVLVLLAGIGDSAQGLVNAILFCAFTQVVRRKLIESFKRISTCQRCRKKQTIVYLMHPTPPPSTDKHEDTTQCDDEAGDQGPYYAVAYAHGDSIKRPLLGGSESLNKYHSINKGIPDGTE